MSAPTGQTYKFSPLASKSFIRFLRILSGSSEQTIRISLEVVDLSHTPEPLHDCLSYTWGNPLYQKILPPQNGVEITDGRKFPIECDDLIICVAENLLEALRQLSRNGLKSTSGPQRWKRQHRIWVDAIMHPSTGDGGAELAGSDDGADLSAGAKRRVAWARRPAHGVVVSFWLSQQLALAENLRFSPRANWNTSLGIARVPAVSSFWKTEVYW